MVRLLEATGARRIELVNLTVAAVEEAHLSTAFSRALSIAGNLVKNIEDPAIQAGWVKSRLELLAMVTLSSRDYSFNQKPSTNSDRYE